MPAWEIGLAVFGFWRGYGPNLEGEAGPGFWQVGAREMAWGSGLCACGGESGACDVGCGIEGRQGGGACLIFKFGFLWVGGPLLLKDSWIRFLQRLRG